MPGFDCEDFSVVEFIDDFGQVSDVAEASIAGQPFFAVGPEDAQWSTPLVLQLIESGDADAYTISVSEVGTSAGQNIIQPIKYEDPSAGDVIANLYLRSFGRQLRPN